MAAFAIKFKRKIAFQNYTAIRMQKHESNAMMTKEFLKKMASLDRQDHQSLGEGLAPIALVLGQERIALELLPLLRHYSAFYDKATITALVDGVASLDFDLRKERVLEELLDFFGHFLGQEDCNVRSQAFDKIVIALSAHKNKRVLQNFLWKLYAEESHFRRRALFKLVRNDAIAAEIIAEQDFLESFFSKVLEEKQSAFKKQGVRAMVHLLRLRPTAFSQVFLQEAINSLFRDPNYFVVMHAVDVALCISDSILFENYFKKLMKTKNFYVSKHLFDKIREVKQRMPALVSEEFFETFTIFLYEQDIDLRNMSFAVLPTVVDCSSDPNTTKKLLGCVKNVIGSNLNKEFRYSMVVAMLKCCKSLSKDLLIDAVLKPLLTFIREDVDLIDAYFVENLFFFLDKVGFEAAREGFAVLFKALVAHNSQHVG